MWKELLKRRIKAILDLPLDAFSDSYADKVVVLFRRETCAEEPKSLARGVQKEARAQRPQPLAP